MPTPPAPAWTRMRSPARRRATFLSACHEVMKTTGSVAASSNDSFARNAADITAARQRLRREAEHGEAEDAISRRDVRHVRHRRL